MKVKAEVTYHEIRGMIEECKDEKQLLRVVEDIMRNTKKYGLDEVDLDKLEQVGMRKYEQFKRERSLLIKNKKQGFNNFD
jgi:hypothetical protein